MEKKGLADQLKAVGCQNTAGLYWADEMRVGLMGQTKKVWAPVGVKVKQAREYKREWSYLNLAVNVFTGQTYWDWTTNMKGESIAPIVRQWEKQGVEVIVWDGARGHRGATYEQLNSKRIVQPPYSPELNPVERIFEFLRDKVEGKVYGTIVTKKEAVEAELKKLISDKICSLTGWAWIKQAITLPCEPNTVF